MAGDLIDVPAFIPTPKGKEWKECGVCGQGYTDKPGMKGFCSDCRRMKTFLKPVIDTLIRIEVDLDK